jgi:hypothetical protein
MRHKIRSSRRGPSELLCGGNVVSLHDQTMITSGLPVSPPGPMPSAEIISYKPTSRYLSAGCPTVLSPNLRPIGDFA